MDGWTGILFWLAVIGGYFALLWLIATISQWRDHQGRPK